MITLKKLRELQELRNIYETLETDCQEQIVADEAFFYQTNTKRPDSVLDYVQGLFERFIMNEWACVEDDFAKIMSHSIRFSENERLFFREEFLEEINKVASANFERNISVRYDYPVLMTNAIDIDIMWNEDTGYIHVVYVNPYERDYAKRVLVYFLQNFDLVMRIGFNYYFNVKVKNIRWRIKKNIEDGRAKNL